MTVKLLLGGDAMLGRLVKRAITQHGFNYPLAPVSPIIQQADLAIVNLECAITDTKQHWRGTEKAFYFGAPVSATQTLVAAGINIVSLANNHILDFDRQGLYDTLAQLQQANIQYCGAGKNIKEAKSPVYFASKQQKFAMMAYCDHQADFLASDSEPGINYLDLSQEAQAFKILERDFESIKHVTWPILSLHWGPNMVAKPSEAFKRIAHHAIEIGYKIIYGHSAHIFQGIEIYRGYPILYACGDVIDDYYVDPDFKNDHQLLFELSCDNDRIIKIDLYPIYINQCQTNIANDTQFAYIAEKMHGLCAKLGTTVQRNNNKLTITI